MRDGVEKMRSDSSKGRWAVGAAVVVYGLLVAMLVFMVLNGGEDFRLLPLSPDFLVGLMAPGLAALILATRPQHAVGWVLLAAGAASVVFGFANQIGMYSFERWGVSGLLTLWAWLAQWTWYPSFGLMFTLLPLLFPDGRVPSARWRPVLWAAAVVVGIETFVLATRPGPLLEGAVPVENPVGLSFTPTVGAWMDRLLVWGWPLLVSLCLGAVVSRYRRADSEQRAQLRWWLAAAAIGTGFYLLTEQGVVLALLVPPATAVAIVRYRLYDIDRVLIRAVVFAALAGLVLVVYGLAVGLTTMVAGRTVEPSFGLSVAVTIVAAVAFLPLRERLDRLARRLVYGQRAAPYDVLTALASRISQTLSVEDVVPELTARVGQALGASATLTRAYVPEGPARQSIWPDGSPIAGQPIATRVITNAGHPVGELAVYRRDETRLSDVEHRLLDDLVAHAGPALHNVALHEQLQRQLEALQRQASQLRASRERLYAAETTARRSVERDLHDGTQQQLVALAVHLGREADTLQAQDPETAERLRRFQRSAEATLDGLRHLTRGLHPAVLTDLGIGPALRAYVASTDAPVRVHASAARLPPHLEAAVYFCITEAIQNATKHAQATVINVHVDDLDGQLRFIVDDDGRGFEADRTTDGVGLRNMHDRVEAVGGRIDVTSVPDQGTRIEGRIQIANWSGTSATSPAAATWDGLLDRPGTSAPPGRACGPLPPPTDATSRRLS